MKITLVESGSPELAACVLGYVGSEFQSNGTQVRRVIAARPNSFVQIILDGQHAMVDVERGTRAEAPVAGLFGPLTHYHFDMEITGALRTFSIRLQPAAAAQLFGLDPVALVDTFVPITLPPGLLNALRAARTWQEMVVPTNRWLVGLMAGRKCNDPVAMAARHLREQHGIVSVQDLADSAGLSLRQFQRRFRALTGLNPKHYARICRIGQTVHRKELEPEASWTNLAMECGYSDQSHFIRDFKALTGVLPRNFLRGQSPIKREPKWDG